MPVVVVPGLGGHLSSLARSQVRGVSTASAVNSRVDVGDSRIPKNINNTGT